MWRGRMTGRGYTRGLWLYRGYSLSLRIIEGLVYVEICNYPGNHKVTVTLSVIKSVLLTVDQLSLIT